MRASDRFGKVSINFLLWGLIAIWWVSAVPKVSAQTYDFDEGLEAVTTGLVSENREILKNKKIAVFGIIENKSGKKWEISSHIEDGIVDELVNNGYRVIERRRIQDVIKKEIKKVTDLWFDQARIAQFGKLVGADFIVTGRYGLWGQGMLKISIRAINVADGEIVGAERVKVHTDRIANLLKSEEKKKQVKKAKTSPAKPVVKPATEERKTTLSINANVSDAKVLVDGREIGRTPLSDAAVSPGEHKIRVEKQGYEPYGKRIRLGKGRSMSLYVDLREAGPLKGRLYVETAPDNATVKILNIGPKFHQGMELDPGRYHVAVSARNYRTEKMWVDLSAGEDKNISMRLERIRLQAGSKAFTNSLGMKFVKIPSGSFMMGSGLSASETATLYGGKEKWYKREHPQHQVTISKPFYMQTMEVTVGQWRSFVQGSGYKTEAETGGGAHGPGNKWEKKEGIYWDNPGFDQGENNPVTCVSWNDVQAFLKWLNRKEGNTYRLPTEAEWEYAARAGTKTPFYTGDCLSTEQANYDGKTKHPGKGCIKGTYRKKTTRVGTFSPNPWGLYDMHGNVWEWCHDWYTEEYSSGSATDPTGPSSGSHHVYRGGSWRSTAKLCRSAKRFMSSPGSRHYGLGFRLARNPDFKFIKGGGVSEERIPNISGKWKISFNHHPGVMEISGGSGRFNLHAGWEEMLDLTIKGNRIFFRRARADQRYQGTIDGGSMKGTFSQYGGSGEYPWTAELKKGGGFPEERIRIPNISGKWKINFNGYLGFMEISGGSGHYSGRLNFGSWEEMLDLTIKGNRILFRRARADQRYQGTIDGSSMKGTFSQYGGSGEYPWTAELKR